MTLNVHIQSIDLPAGTVEYRKRRETGSYVTVIDAERSPDFRADEGGRWVTYCEAHDAFCQHDTRALASSFAAAPSEWCEGCRPRTTTRSGSTSLGDGDG